MNLLPPHDSPDVPKYWRNETSGILAEAIQNYLNNHRLDAFDIAAIRTYLRQWIDSPAWEMNPHITDEGRTELKRLREQATAIKSVRDIRTWIHEALAIGIDPL